jgi:predicted glutamine amidotransferase
MLAAPSGIPGHIVSGAFLRMARGENSVNEKNTALGLVRHGHGWGAVLESGGEKARVRSARPCWDDAAFLQVRSASVHLLHARLASVAGVGTANTHPFSAEVRGETWYFCHNGTLRDEPDDGTGTTDSERFFRRMLPLIERGEPVLAFESAAGILRDVTALNSLLLGPDGLWAFCVWADPRSRAYYTLSWAETPYGALVSSESLRDVAAQWTPMENGTVLWIPARPTGVRLVRLRLPGALTPAAE